MVKSTLFQFYFGCPFPNFKNKMTVVKGVLVDDIVISYSHLLQTFITSRFCVVLGPAINCSFHSNEYDTFMNSLAFCFIV